MRASITTAVLAAVIAAGAVGIHAGQGGSDEQAIRAIVRDAYVSGIFIARDEAAVRRGLHPDFVLTVHQGDRVIVAPLDMWLERLKLDGVRSPDTVTYDVDLVDVTGRTAFIKLRVSINGRHRYTDYLGLYRFDEGWRIVNKVYEDH